MRRAERECSNAKARRGPPERPTLTPRATYLSALAEPATSCSGTQYSFLFLRQRTRPSFAGTPRCAELGTRKKKNVYRVPGFPYVSPKFRGWSGRRRGRG